jgi:DNA replication protein DnaC
MTAQTLHQLRELKLGGMASALEQQLQQTDTFEGLPFVERLSLLLDQEHLLRENRKQTRLIKQARFRVSATVQEIDYQHKRNLQRDVIARLASCDWINRKQNLLVTGPCGSGKTYIACALGHNACLREHSVRYYRLSRLLQELTQAKADGSYTRLLKQLSRTSVILLDDWGLEPLQPAHRHDLLEILDDRHDSSSTVVISQLPLDQWYVSIGDNTLADAILDRLMHNAHKLELRLEGGDSMRKRYAQKID